MNERVIRCAKALATTLERLLAFGILLGVVVFAFQSHRVDGHGLA